MASKQHGLTTMNATRPKSSVAKKNNKAKARVRKAELLKALHDSIQTAKGSSSSKKKSV